MCCVLCAGSYVVYSYVLCCVSCRVVVFVVVVLLLNTDVVCCVLCCVVTLVSRFKILYLSHAYKYTVKCKSDSATE